MANVVILGGGLTGLSAAYHLEQQNCFDYCLFEKESTVGGLVRSVQRDGFTFDYTGHLLHISDPYFREFIEDVIGFENLIEHQRRACIWSHNRYTPYPFQENLRDLPSSVITECIEGFVKRTRIQNPTTFYAWVMKHFGAGMANHFFFPYNEKQLCTPAKKLMASWTNRFVPKTTLETIVHNLVTNPINSHTGYNSTFFYPKTNGIKIVIDGLSKRLKNPVMTGYEVVEINTTTKTITFANGHNERYGKLISTIPLPKLLGILTPNTALNTTRKKLHAVNVVNFNLGIKRAAISDNHWVYTPERELPFYRFGFWHNFSPHMAPVGHSSVYGELSYRPEQGDAPARDDTVIVPSHADIQRRTDNAVQKLLDILHLNNNDIVLRHDLVLPNAYVIYDQWRENNLAKIHAALNAINIQSIGRFGEWKYSSMQEAVLDGRSAV